MCMQAVWLYAQLEAKSKPYCFLSPWKNTDFCKTAKYHLIGMNTTDAQGQTERKLECKVGPFKIVYEDNWFLEVCLSSTVPNTAHLMHL